MSRSSGGGTSFVFMNMIHLLLGLIYSLPKGSDGEIVSFGAEYLYDYSSTPVCASFVMMTTSMGREEN